MSPSDRNDFFIGWSPDMPKADRRTFLLSGIAMTLAGAGIAAGVASQQRPVGPGQWNQGAIRDWRGRIFADPYPMIRTADIDGTVRTAFLSCMGKCGVRDRLRALEDGEAIITGSLIHRGPHAMIAVIDGADWVRPVSGTRLDPAFDMPRARVLGEASLKGEILDTKCWFGAMRPAQGKVHKSCAALCIQAGLPPALFTQDTQGNERIFIMTDSDGPHGDAILPLVADPVEVSGTVIARGETLYLDSPASAITRI